MPNSKPYPSGVSDKEWAFVVPYLALVRARTTHQKGVAERQGVHSSRPS